ncbi:hypothetical protein Tco_0835797 [Tanacetum coccineum]
MSTTTYIATISAIAAPSTPSAHRHNGVWNLKGNPMKEKILLNVNSGTESEIMCSIASHPLRETRQQGGDTSFSYEADVKKWSSQDFSFAFSVFKADIL